MPAQTPPEEEVLDTYTTDGENLQDAFAKFR